MNARDLSGLSDEKLKFVIDNGDPNGQLYSLAKQALQSRSRPDMPVLATAKELKSDLSGTIARTQLPEPHHGVAQGLSDAAGGLMGGALSSVPGVAPALEAVGDLSDALVPGQNPAHNVFPRPGQIHAAMEQSPQGAQLSQVAGASIPMLGQAGMLGAAMRSGSDAALAPATSIYRNLAGQTPGMTRTVAAGAGTGAALGAGEAAIRRVPGAVASASNAISPGGHVPASFTPPTLEELAVPAALGAGMSIAPGIASWATNPRTAMGDMATRFARDRASGAHQQEPLASLMEGQSGIDQAKVLADEAYQDRMPALEAPVRAQERRAKASLGADLQEGKGQAERAKGQIGAEAEQQIQAGLQSGRAAASRDLVSTLDSHEQAGTKVSPDAQFADETGALKSSFYERIREIVGRYSRQDTEGSRAAGTKVSPLADASGRPIEVKTQGPPGSGEEHTPLGQRLADIESGIRGYLKDGGTVRDWRNVLTYLKTMAESGTPEKSFPYKEFVGAVREHLGDSVPEIAQANARYTSKVGGLERVKGSVYGDPDLHDLGTSTAPGPLDVPEAGAPITQQRMPPADEARGARNLAQLEDNTVTGGAKASQVQELIDNGFGPEVENLRKRLAEVKQMTFETQQKHDDAVAKVEADVKSQLLDLSRQLGTETDHVLKSKEALEASTPRFSKLMHPMTMAAMAATTHSPAHAGSLGAYAGEKLGGLIAQPIASQAALRLPDAGVMRSQLPGYMGMATAASQGSKELVQEARDHANRLKASIGDRLKAKE